MDFDLTSEQHKRVTEVLESVRARLDPARATRSGPHLSRAEWQVAADIGLTGLCLPAEFGGGDLGALDTALCLEAFGRGCSDMGLVFAVSAHLLACAVPVRDHADDEVRAELLTGLATGRLVAANAMTEDGAGSDVGRLSTTATADGDHYILDGEKSFASNAPIADLLVTYAVTDPAAGFLGITAFAVPRELPGVHIGQPFDKMGLASCPAGRVRFDRCRVPAAYRLGRPGQGAAIFQQSMAWERGCLCAGYLGRMEQQLERCVAHARERRQFGRAIGEFQAVSHRIARMRQRLDASRLLLHRGCWALDSGADHAVSIALAKVAVSEAAVENSVEAIQLFGGAGYLTSTGIEENLRDAIPSTVFSGTSEIQREIVAREVGL